jgi:hypothetical protein
MRKLSILLLCFAAITFTFSSCYRKKDTIAKVTVVDSAGLPVGGASVRLYYEDILGGNTPRENLEQTNSTDASGIATFNYNDLFKSGQAGFAILDIDVDADIKVGIIRIEQEETSEESVAI